MGKTDNKKRAKRLKEAKKERETNELIAAGIGPAGIVLKERAKEKGVTVFHNTRKVKYSDVLKKFASNIFTLDDDFDSAKSKLYFASIVWNAVVLKPLDEIKFINTRKIIINLGNSVFETAEMFDELVEIKDDEYSEEDFIFVDIEVKQLSNGDLDLSVMISQKEIEN
ncbi:MAG: hypothetical protein ACOYMA_03825 [Bacteroidia bacterium]